MDKMTILVDMKFIDFHKYLILLVPPARFELAAHGLGIQRSIP